MIYILCLLYISGCERLIYVHLWHFYLHSTQLNFITLWVLHTKNILKTCCVQQWLTRVTAYAIFINTAIMYAHPTRVQNPSTLTAMHTDTLVSGFPKHCLYTLQFDSTVIITSFMVRVFNSVAFDNCLQIQSYICRLFCSVGLFTTWIIALTVSCNVPLKLHTCSRCDPSPDSTQLLITSLTALHASVIVTPALY